MLKYTFSKDAFLNKDNQVKVLSSAKERMLGIYGDTKLRFLCECDSVKDFTEGMPLMARNDVTIVQDEVGHTGTSYTFTEVLTVNSVNTDEVTISMYVDKYISLPLSYVALMRYRQQDLVNDELVVTYVDYVYFYFQESHYFANPDYTYRDEDDVYKDCLYIKYGKADDDIIVIPYDDYEYITSSTLRVKKAYFTDTSEYTQEVYSLMFEGLDSSLSTTQSVDGRIDDIEPYRDTFLYEYDEENEQFTYALYFDRPIQVLHVPITQNTATNLLHEMAVQQDFVDVKKAEAINKIIDMEKDVYYPVIATGSGEDISFSPIYKLIFNLHFREHRGDDWIVGDDGYWNGTYSGTRSAEGNDYASIELMNESSDTEYGYFSYLETEEALHDASYQSDLLSYLDFTNEDVRYQKNKIKKSFLRLSFYDSTNPANQNLLFYSTIFMDTTKLFSRYSKHFQDKPYSLLDEDSGTTKQKLTGIRVNREPCGDLVTQALKDDDDIETIRLSSQLVIEDKYNASSSSEGFYVYIWRDNESPLPQDLYMKAEFNHAGHGRTLPMMAPYWREEENVCDDEEKRGFKTFEQIVEDWNVVEKNGDAYTKKEDTLVGYGIQEYLRYSYIHFKYQYDVKSKQHYYYLDNEQYCDNNLSTVLDNTLILNLYEAKLSSQNSNDDDVVTYCYDCENMVVTLTYDNIPAEGGTASPQVSYSLPVYNCNDVDEKTPITNPLTEKNSVATYTFSGIVEDSSGVVVERNANSETKEKILGEVTVQVDINGCSQSATCIVKQDGAIAYDYQDPVVDLSYPAFPWDGGTIMPEYSYYQEYTHGDESGVIENENGELLFEFVDGGIIPATATKGLFTLDENTGELSYSGVNEEEGIELLNQGVRLTVTMNGKSGYADVLELQQDFNHDSGGTVYDDPTVNLSYFTASYDGGAVRCIYSYSQNWRIDGVEQTPITSGGELEFTKTFGDDVATIDQSTGYLNVLLQNLTPYERTLGEVTLTVTLNGKVGSSTCEVKQEEIRYRYIVYNNTDTRFYHTTMTYIDSGGTTHKDVDPTGEIDPNGDWTNFDVSGYYIAEITEFTGDDDQSREVNWPLEWTLDNDNLTITIDNVIRS